MKTSAALCATLLTLTTSAVAAGQPTDPWAGCYAGAHAGYGSANVEGTVLNQLAPVVGADLNAPIGSATVKGGALGIQLGCDVQTNDWVMGAQISLDRADMSGDHLYINGSSPANQVNYDIKQIATLTVRTGYLIQAATLVYLKGGAAWTKTDHTDNDPSVAIYGHSELTRSGWLLGAGVEHLVQPNVTLFAEYSYMDFGKETTSITYNSGDVWRFSFKQDMSYLGLGVNYRFK